ncbi:hypothetical protein G3I77_10915 [Streptomyces sp. D2-8]|uniref:hypothetical protein n=1 Tax=Streptomyces sp. D2-8 TaxID=2707767 RepID=UPI0020BE306A|nr:hypothetical protein [Streptomyces sp. D2-8]MCK8433530.1 hypothetical protein [Streptomyces sp. D2-8]
MSLRPFNPEFLPEGHPDKIVTPPRGTALGALWRGLVRFLLRPSYQALVALGSMHVAALWLPEFGPQCRPPQEEPSSYRTSRAGLERRP